jgi:hypothetical protein
MMFFGKIKAVVWGQPLDNCKLAAMKEVYVQGGARLTEVDGWGRRWAGIYIFHNIFKYLYIISRRIQILACV